MEKLPQFKYHPDPLRTGAVEESETECVCCHRKRGFIYVAGVYATGEYDELICPWCIADGSAAKKFDATFYGGLFDSQTPSEVRDEINRRTPGYNSWQSEEWKTHCGDVCEFHGDAPKTELHEVAINPIRLDLALNDDEWTKFVEHYEPGGDPAIYKFVCRHCGEVIYNWDCS